MMTNNKKPVTKDERINALCRAIGTLQSSLRKHLRAEQHDLRVRGGDVQVHEGLVNKSIGEFMRDAFGDRPMVGDDAEEDEGSGMCVPEEARRGQPSGLFRGVTLAGSAGDMTLMLDPDELPDDDAEDSK